MNDPLIFKARHNGVIFVLEPYNAIPKMGSIESPIEGAPTMPEAPAIGW